MLPLPTANAIAVFTGAILLVAIGVAFESATVVVFASSLFAGLGAALALTMPLGARMRARRLELTWWHAHADQLASRGAVLTGVPFEIHAALRHPGAQPLIVGELKPALASHVRCTRGQGMELVLPAMSRTELRFTLVADAPGRVVLHGLSLTVPGPLDLFRAPLYFPSVLVVKALPKAAARTAPSSVSRASAAVERAGQTERRARGAGSDLRELRELMPGDPFKAIAWKASARVGKLMVREVESEVQETFYVVLDVSGSMRGGEPGTRKLDHAIEVAALAARQALERGDRVGVITVDGRIVSHAHPRAGLSHLPALHEALLAATEIVDQDLTEPDDDELLGIVARYVRQQDGARFATPEGIDIDSLVRHAAAALSLEREPRGVLADVVASDRRTKILRRFCRARGIPLKHRAETRGFGKGLGLARALREAAGSTRVPRSILFITDFDGVFLQESLEKTLRLLRAERHSLTCIFPDARGSEVGSGSALVADLALVYGLGEERRLREARAWLGKLGTAVYASSPTIPTRSSSFFTGRRSA